MNFKISLIGRVNVGKSTLFNKLTKKNNKSFVSDFPGITRDRKYGEFIYNKSICIIDTGAIIDYPNIKLSNKILIQTKLAIEESNIIFFILEADIGISSKDYKIFNILKTYNKEIILIVNKLDKKKYNYDFFSLKINNIYYISAKYNKGIKTLFKFLKNYLFYNKNFSINKTNRIIKKKYNIIVLGKSNVGKSTLINRILKNERLIVSNYPGTTLDSIKSNLEYKNICFTITDTLGINNKFNYLLINNKLLINKNIYNNLINYNIVIFIINITEIITKKEISEISKINKLGKLIIIIVNKIDLLNKKDKIDYKEIIEKKLLFIKYIKIFYISALYSSNINYIISYIYNLNINSNKIFKTKFINNILKESINNLKPNIFNKSLRPKLKYAYIASNNPFKLIIHGKNLNFINHNYKKYLENFFKKKLKINNIPINIFFKDN